jgi:hypothetical protein
MDIGIDIDNVLADTIPSFLHFLDYEYGIHIRKPDITQFEFSYLIGRRPDEVLNLFNEFFRSDYSNNIKPVEGSVEAVSQLNKCHQVSVITARSPEFMEKTAEWLDRHYSGFKGLYSASSYGLDGAEKKKSEVCADLGIKMMIDDALHTAEDCSQNGIHALLYDCPWNQAELADGIVRVYSWQDILKKLDSLPVSFS